MKNAEEYKDEYRIRAYDTSPDGKAGVSALLRMLEDIAGAHAILRGAGVPDLLEQGITWVLSRIEVKFYRRPGMGERLIGETWPREAKGLKACREFRFTDQEGNLVMEGASIWLVIDLEKRRPVRVTTCMDKFTLREEMVFEKEPGKLTFQSPPASEEKIKVPYSALDMNDHVNNIYYVTRAMDSIPDILRTNREIERISLNYIAECFKGDSLSVGSSMEEGTLNQTVYRGDEEVCKIQSLWKDRM
ncbi:MAG: hypothetical protein JEY99_10150 [Spirochaetales bacterium]|nr:hypothetical protein [Spirochaetales bacterium]